MAIFRSFLVIKQLYRTRLRDSHIWHDVSDLLEGPCVMLWREESRFGLLFSLTLTKKRPFLGYFLAHFRLKNFSTGSNSEPHMTGTMHLFHMKALTSWFHRRSLVSDWYSVSPSRKRGLFFTTFFRLFLAHFRLKNFSTGPDSEPHMSKRCI